MPNQRRNAYTRDYSITAIPSSNPFSVSPQTITTRIACEHWRPAKTLSRGDTTRETVRRLLGASRGLSRPITRANHSIGSPYESNCINGYRQGSHSVISQRDSSNVLGHQVSLELHNHDHDQHRHPIRIRIRIKQRSGFVSRSRFDHDQDSDQQLITIMISITIRSRFVSGLKVKNRLRAG